MLGLFAGLVLLLLFVAGGWWFFFARYTAANGSAPSPVQVFILSPASGEEYSAGDMVAVDLQSFAEADIQSVELFVDGQSQGVVTDSRARASWTWRAWPVGIHVLSAKAITANGQSGSSQTVIVTVLTGDGLMQVPAEEGQTLPEVGAPFGASPEEMAAANPQIDPTQPLAGGQPVQAPVQPGGAGAGPGSGGGGGKVPPEVEAFFPILVNWQFKPTEPVEKSYCYTSQGNGNWEKMPKKPFEFFSGAQVNYPQYDFEVAGKNEIVIQVQCWGWLGNALKFLGQGETKISKLQPQAPVQVIGQGFQLTGTPQFPIKPVKTLGGGDPIVPPPYAVREPENTADCAKHYGSGLALFVCDTLLNAKVKQYQVIEWEWLPKICWIGDEKCATANKIQGYRVYEINPLDNKMIYLKEVKNPAQKAVAVPLPWGYRCYGVESFTNTTEYGLLTSEIATYCPGEPPQPQKLVVNPSDWLTTGGNWIEAGDCDTYGGADAYLLANQNSGFGNTGEVLVGSYIVDDEEEDCFREGNYAGAVKFSLGSLPAGSVIQKANLKFSSIYTTYKASGVAVGAKPICISGIGKAKQDWTALGSNHYYSQNTLFSSAYNSPFVTFASYGYYAAPSIDVTPIVNTWSNHPELNHGFIITPAFAPLPLSEGTGTCESGLGSFQLEIFYYPAP